MVVPVPAARAGLPGQVGLAPVDKGRRRRPDIVQVAPGALRLANALRRPSTVRRHTPTVRLPVPLEAAPVLRPIAVRPCRLDTGLEEVRAANTVPKVVVQDRRLPAAPHAVVAPIEATGRRGTPAETATGGQTAPATRLVTVAPPVEMGGLAARETPRLLEVLVKKVAATSKAVDVPTEVSRPCLYATGRTPARQVGPVDVVVVAVVVGLVIRVTTPGTVVARPVEGVPIVRVRPPAVVIGRQPRQTAPRVHEVARPILIILRPPGQGAVTIRPPIEVAAVALVDGRRVGAARATGTPPGPVVRPPVPVVPKVGVETDAQGRAVEV